MADADTPLDESRQADDKAKQLNLGAACFRCRGFRHACDRQKPACSRCKRRGITCTYPEAAPTLKKLQKATETLGDRIRKFGDRLKSPEGMPKEFRAISLQRLANKGPSTPMSEVGTPPSISETSDTRSSISVASESTTSEHEQEQPMASTSNFSVYPCSKCFKDLQQCDLTLPRCSRCEGNDFECVYQKTEPKANHVSQVLTTMNKVMDQWQESIDRMAKDFAQKTRDFGQRANNSLKIKPLQPAAWKITSTTRGLSVESNVNSYNDLSKLVDQFKKSLHIGPAPPEDDDEETASRSPSMNDERQRIAQAVELDDASSIHTSSGFSFAIWNSWSHPTHALPQDYPIDISDELTDNLVNLYCRSPCCSAIRLPVVDTTEFLSRYNSANEADRPSKVLIYALCAMAARNAFQLHVWSHRPSHETPRYNMGKALSMAYSLKARELLSDCFDEPSMDNCQAAFLLSYCNHQNGYAGVIYIYEWIAYNMAHELGLYDNGRELTEREAILVWCLYYFNTWYRVLQGGSSSSVESSQFYPRCELPEPGPKPEMMEDDTDGELSQALIDYYVWSTWYYLIRLQILRHDVMSRLVMAQRHAGKPDPDLPFDLMVMQERLQAFYDSLPSEWRDVDLAALNSSDSSSPCSSGSSPSADSNHTHHHHRRDSNQQYQVDLPAFARFCVLNVHLYYNINKILLYQAFLPSDHLPTTPFSIQCLYVSVDAAYSITQTLQYMARQSDECNVHLLGFLFANIVYVKLLNYNDEYCQDFARRCLQLSVDISKASVTYLYDFEMAKSLVNVMEQEVRSACGARPPPPMRTNSIDSTCSSMWSHNSSSFPSPLSHHLNNLSMNTFPTTASNDSIANFTSPPPQNGI